MNYSNEEISKIDALITAFGCNAAKANVRARTDEPLPLEMQQAPLWVEYYNAIKAGSNAPELRQTFLTRFVRENINNEHLIKKYL